MVRGNLAYMAGLYDGEGYIGIVTGKRKHRPTDDYRLYCKLGMCNPYLPQLFQSHFGGLLTTHKLENRRRVWVWQIVNEPAAQFLKALLPYLRLKKNEAELGIEFRSRYKRAHSGRSKLPDSELAIREAQKTLMASLKDKTKQEEN